MHRLALIFLSILVGSIRQPLFACLFQSSLESCFTSLFVTWTPQPPFSHLFLSSLQTLFVHLFQSVILDSISFVIYFSRFQRLNWRVYLSQGKHTQMHTHTHTNTHTHTDGWTDTETRMDGQIDISTDGRMHSFSNTWSSLSALIGRII